MRSTSSSSSEALVPPRAPSAAWPAVATSARDTCTRQVSAPCSAAAGAGASPASKRESWFAYAFASASAREGRSTECTLEAYLTTDFALFVCNWPINAQCGGCTSRWAQYAASSRAFALASWSRFSPKRVTPPSSSAAASEAGKNFVTVTSCTGALASVRTALWSCSAARIRSSTRR